LVRAVQRGDQALVVRLTGPLETSSGVPGQDTGGGGRRAGAAASSQALALRLARGELSAGESRAARRRAEHEHEQ